VLTAILNSYVNRQNFTPPLYKINTPEPIDKKISVLDYVCKGTPVPNLVEIRPLGLMENWVKYNKNYFYLFIYLYLFSLTRLQVRRVDGFLCAIAQKT